MNAAVEDFYRRWEFEEPVVDDERGALPPLEVGTAAAPPDVVLSLRKFSEVPISCARLVDALSAALPEDASMRLLTNPRLPGSRREPLVFLELRMAQNAAFCGYDWQVPAETWDTADHYAIAWINQLTPPATTYLTASSGRSVPITLGDELTNLQAQHATSPSASLTSVLGAHFHKIAAWFSSAHLSLVVGTTAPDNFDHTAAMTALIEQFRHLEPVTRAAVLYRGTDITNCCNGVYAFRNHIFLTQRRALSAETERLAEEHGLVDAQPIVFVTEPPPGIDPTWTQQPLGHLTQITAPNLDDWLTQTPTQDTIDAGRKALHPLLQSPIQL